MSREGGSLCGFSSLRELQAVLGTSPAVTIPCSEHGTRHSKTAHFVESGWNRGRIPDFEFDAPHEQVASRDLWFFFSIASDQLPHAI